MDEIIPWDEWAGLIKPHHFSVKRGHPPKEIEKMLRMYLLQCWFTLPNGDTTAMLSGSLWVRILADLSTESGNTLMMYQNTFKQYAVSEPMRPQGTV